METAPILEIRDVVKDFGGVRAVDTAPSGLCQAPSLGSLVPTEQVRPPCSTWCQVQCLRTAARSSSEAGVSRRMNMHQTFGLGLMRTFQIPREMKRMTVLENLMLVPAPQLGERVWASWMMPWRVAREERRIEAQAIKVLELVTLSHLANEYAGNLSGGQKKLLELARTLMAEPKMVLLDEPGAGVNRTLLREISSNILLASVERDITFVIIEHDMKFIMTMCDPIIVMANGAVIAQGTPTQVQEDSEVLEAYLGGPAGGIA